MEDLTKRFMRQGRLLTKGAHDFLSGKPALISRIESLLDEGKDLPLMIELEHVEGLDISEEEKENYEIIKESKKMDTDGPVPPALDSEKEIGPAPVPPPVEGGDIHDISVSVTRTMDALRSKSPPLERNRPSGPGGTPRPLASEYGPEINILKDINPGLEGQGKIDDFKKLFMDRFRSMKLILEHQYGDLYPAREIYDLQGSDDGVRFIGIIESMRYTKNGHIMLILEDPTGSIKVLLSKNKKELQNVRLVNDEVIGIAGKFKSGEGRSGSIVFANKVFKVDVPPNHRRRTSTVKGLTAAFTSDVHIGSRNYLDKEWKRMVSWLRGERSSSVPARDGTRVKYLVLAGDLVDGIGTYPNQEKDLVVHDIYKQYEMLAESFYDIPEHVEIIMIPGNHDVVRLAEPQPVLPKDFQEIFSYDNVHFLSNPSYFSIHGVNVLGYHGKSFDDMVTIFKDVSYDDPVPGMVEMLRSRHLSPAYGMRNQLAPAESDCLIIDEVPDIFVTGHVHSFGMGYYKGVQLVQGSTWQSQTDFQKMMNFKPQPAKMGLIELDKPKDQAIWEIT